jgi:lysophospholipase L1-like esterase
MIRLSKNCTVLFIGDSITHGGRGLTMDLNHIMGHGFQSIIASRLAYDNRERTPKFVNKGISGDTSYGIYARIESDVIPYCPDIVSLLCGVNDLGRIDLPTEAVVGRYLESVEGFVRDIQSALPDVKIILCEPFYYDVQNQDAPYEGIPHPKCEEDFTFHNRVRDEEAIQKRKHNLSLMQKGLREICARYKTIFVPMQDLFDEAAKQAPASYFIWDNIHPTMVGHEMMARRSFEVVEDALGEK